MERQSVEKSCGSRKLGRRGEDMAKSGPNGGGGGGGGGDDGGIGGGGGSGGGVGGGIRRPGSASCGAGWR